MRVGWSLPITKNDFYDLTIIERYLLCDALSNHINDTYGEEAPPDRGMRKSGF